MTRRRCIKSLNSLKNYGLAGLGVWALGMDGANSATVNALEGSPPAIQYATLSVPNRPPQRPPPRPQLPPAPP